MVDGVKYSFISDQKTFHQADETCKSMKMRVFEPRDSVLYHKVLAKMDIQEDIWLNMFHKETGKKK